jgi:hypothetical protein
MERRERERRREREAEREQGQPIVVGIALVLVGISFLTLHFVRQYLIHFDFARYGWPLLVLTPGLVLIGVGMSIEEVGILCLTGAILSMTGMVLLVQNTLDLYFTWTYLWALITPGALGLGMWLQGIATDRADLRATGLQAMLGGLVMTLLGWIVFEGFFRVSGEKEVGFLATFVVSTAVIAIGIGMLVRASPRKPRER